MADPPAYGTARDPDTADERTRYLRLRRAAVTAVVGAAAVAVAWGEMALVIAKSPYWGIDFAGYYASGEAVLSGGSPYGLVVAPLGRCCAYPPFAATFFAPLSVFGEHTAGLIWTALSLACLFAVLWFSLRHETSRRLPRTALLASCSLGTVFLIWLGPVQWTLIGGQVNLLLLFFVVADLTLPDQARWKGIGIGIAAGIKLIPGIFMLYLLLTRRYRAFAVSFSAFLGTVLIGFFVLPSDSLRYWTGGFADLRRFEVTTQIDRHELRSALARLMHGTAGITAPWLIACALVAVIGVTAATLAGRRSDEMLGMLCAAGTSLLISPVAWEHHWVWIVPLFVMLTVRAWRSGSWPGRMGAAMVVAALVIRPFKWIPQYQPENLHGIQLFYSEWLTLMTLILLIAALVHTTARWRSN